MEESNDPRGYYECEYPDEFRYLPPEIVNEIVMEVTKIKRDIENEYGPSLESHIKCIQLEANKISEDPSAFRKFVQYVSARLNHVSLIFKSAFSSAKRRLQYRLRWAEYELRKVIKKTGKTISLLYSELAMKAIEDMFEWFLAKLNSILDWVKNKIENINWHESPDSISLGISTGIPPSISISLSWNTNKKQR